MISVNTTVKQTDVVKTPCKIYSFPLNQDEPIETNATDSESSVDYFNYVDINNDNSKTDITTEDNQKEKEASGNQGVSIMLNIYDACEWFLQKQSISHKKLQKLCYYAQAWSYALKDSPMLFDDEKNTIEFEAWVHGPVSPIVYSKYSSNGWKDITAENKKLNINENNIELLESVWFTYGDSTGNALEALSHTELPWINARVGIDDMENSNELIKAEDMKKYYRSIYLDN